jgi:hypothetical protein
VKPSLFVIGILVLLVSGMPVVDFVRERSVLTAVQLLGAAFLIIVAFAHVAETFALLPSMGWGLPHSVGHYIDLTGAICGLLFLSAGYLLRRLSKGTA